MTLTNSIKYFQIRKDNNNLENLTEITLEDIIIFALIITTLSTIAIKLVIN